MSKNWNVNGNITFSEKKTYIWFMIKEKRSLHSAHRKLILFFFVGMWYSFVCTEKIIPYMVAVSPSQDFFNSPGETIFLPPPFYMEGGVNNGYNFFRSFSVLSGYHWHYKPVYTGKKEVTAVPARLGELLQWPYRDLTVAGRTLFCIYYTCFSYKVKDIVYSIILCDGNNYHPLFYRMLLQQIDLFDSFEQQKKENLLKIYSFWCII